MNSVRGNARGGEEFAVVTFAFKVTPAFKETIVKKPVLTDTAGKTYNTSVSIIDAGLACRNTSALPVPRPHRHEGRLDRDRHRHDQHRPARQVS